VELVGIVKFLFLLPLFDNNIIKQRENKANKHYNMSTVNVAKVLATQYEPVPVSYTRRDLIVYALGVGASELQFTYENGA